MLKENREWSSYQKKIFYEIAKGDDGQNFIIIARAGCAKTSVLVEGSKYIPKGKRSLFICFNKSIQEELSKRLPSYCEARTIHSISFQAVKKKFPNVQVNNYKCQNIVEEFIGKNNYDLVDSLCKTVHFCKMYMYDTPTKIKDLISYFNIDLCNLEIDEFIKHVCKTLRLCKERTDEVDFDDMIYFCFIYALKVAEVDLCLIDEAQDISKLALEIAISTIKKGGRVIAVLDPLQNLYGFAGADPEILETLKRRLNPKEFSLPISYRCPHKIIKLAKKYAPDIEAHEKNKDGEIINISFDDLHKYVNEGSYVLSRFNFPLIKLCFEFLKSGKRANILGRDIADGLIYLIKKSKKKNVKAFLTWLQKWEEKEKINYIAKRPNGNTEFITDRAECLRTLCEDAKDLTEVKLNIDKLFSDKDEKNIILLSSIHRVKGKQSEKVFILKDTLRYYDQSEKCCVYVALTRTSNLLYFVSKTLDEESDDN
jgi:superfamily I DNA/RNA helicase